MAIVRIPFKDLRTGRIYAAGVEVADDDPAIVGREQFFTGLPAPTADRVEQATAAPGELRASRRGRQPKNTE